jgi:uncharacterized repeat protein (TIGR01451 family)
MTLPSKTNITRTIKEPAFVHLSLNILIVFLSIIVSILFVRLYLMSSPSQALSPEPGVLGVNEQQGGYKLRHQTTTQGALTFTGNSLGLNTASENGSIGTFITTDKNLKDDPYPAGTTSDWHKNSSMAKLRIPENSQVLYAELIWGGNFKSDEFKQDISSELDKPIKFSTPNGTFDITSDSATKANTEYGYVRTSNVTELVKQAGSGEYVAGSIPALAIKEDDSHNYAGWTLAVSYQNASLPMRNLTIFTSSESVYVDQQNGNVAEVKGFATPMTGKVGARLLVSTQEGDSDLPGDQLRFGASKNSLQVVKGPNNKENNFFAAQINNDQGEIDKTGSFGDKNQTPGKSAKGNRHGFDITNIDISDKLTNNQTSAFVQGTSTQDIYVINAVGLQIDVNAANPKVTITVDKPAADPGEVLTYTIDVENLGSAESINNKLCDFIPANTSYVDGSLKLNGQTITLDSNGCAMLPAIAPGAKVSLTLQTTVNTSFTQGEIPNDTKLDFGYYMAAGSEITTGSTNSNQVITKVPNDILAIDDTASAKPGESISIPVLTNDDKKKDAFKPDTLKITAQPQHGTAQINPQTGQITYTPASDFSGTDSFEYEICNTKNQCDTAKVTVTVPAKTEPPVTPPAEQPKTVDTVKTPEPQPEKRPGQVLGVSENKSVLPRTGGEVMFWVLLSLTFTFAIGFTVTGIGHLETMKEKVDKRSEY